MNTDSLRRFARKYMTINAGKSRNVIRDFGIYSAVMAGCTLVGLLFRKQGFSDATIITVYILGVLISASKAFQMRPSSLSIFWAF